MIQLIALKTGGSIRQVCAVLGEARSSFYHAAAPTAMQVADAGVGDLIEAVFRRHRKRYGYRRIAEDLSDRGVTCAPARIRRLMAQRGLHAIQPKTFVPKTSDGRADKPSPNLLSGQPLPAVPDNAWAGDITFIPTNDGWLYLAVVIDLCSRRIVGWSLADHMRSDLVLAALDQALQTRPTRHTIFYSDRGSQYGSTPFRKALAKAGLRQSMSARANPCENPTELWIPLTFIGEAEAGHRGAILYTLVESCRRRGIDPQAYLRDVLTRLPKMTISQIPDVMPEAWSKARRQSHAAQAAA